MTSKSTSVSASEVIAVKGTGFKYTAPPIATFVEQKATLVVDVEDLSGSVWTFRDQLHEMNVRSLQAVQMGSGRNTTSMRATVFSGRFRPNGVKERYGFLPASVIDPAVHFTQFDHGDYGSTPLYNAVYEAIVAVHEEAKRLIDVGGIPLVNANVFITTDGGDTDGGYSPEDIRQLLESIPAEGYLESITTVLVGINVDNYDAVLQDFQKRAGLTRYIAFKDASAKAIAELGQLKSKSIISTSQALGTGGPSQQVLLLGSQLANTP